MFSREWIEKFDASYGIPRKANEQYLPSYQAFWQWSADIGMCVFFFALGLLGSIVCLFAGYLLDVYGLITLVFWAMALICIAGSRSTNEYRPWLSSVGEGIRSDSLRSDESD